MKVLFLTNQLDMGGIETNLVRLTEELCARGHEVVVATGGGTLTPDVVKAGGTHVTLRMTSGGPMALVADVRALRGLIGARRPDVVHVFSARTAVLAWLALRYRPNQSVRPRRVPVVSSTMGLRSWPGESMSRVRLRAFILSLGARRLVVTAPAIAEVVGTLPISARRIVRMSVVGVRLPERGPDPDEARATLDQLGVSPNERVVMTIGRLDPVKSHELFIQAAAQVVASRTDVRFFVVGEGPLRGALEDEIERLGVGRFVTLLGERSDISRLLAVTDVCVRPGIVEGFVGITVLEAQAFGVPVIAFETEDVKLSVIDRETGLLVPQNDTAALAAAVLELVEDPELAARLGAAGRAHLESTFALPVVVDRLEELYAEAISAG